MPFVRQLYYQARQLIRGEDFPYSRYNRTQNCIFIHIPKVAGTSITEAISAGTGRRTHLPWYVYYSANPLFFSQAFKFSFVRNPWDRVFSAYEYLRLGGNQMGDGRTSAAVRTYDTFDNFVVRGLGEGRFRNHLLFLPQAEFVLNGDGDLAVDFVGKFETLDEDFATVAKTLGIMQRTIPKRNSSRQRNAYQANYKSEKSISVVSEIYKQDICAFSYRF